MSLSISDLRKLCQAAERRGYGNVLIKINVQEGVRSFYPDQLLIDHQTQILPGRGWGSVTTRKSAILMERQ